MRPLIDPQGHGLHDLIGTDGVVDRVTQLQCRMIGAKARDLLAEVNVVAAAVGEGQRLHHRADFGDGLCQRLRLHEAFEVEHALARQIGAAA